ncbi:hypothetical protein NCWK1_5056 [Nostoc cycadae WK-1]|uniref:Uncharacterized protein n=1 Tax=Nostoc cycadae WK-1 TaxID=1861711 RepID=A0A2H6LPZ5_9NOSO|nr:hypothetical protein NCWK1_5056 [Nostoc cycadae WK-1]
MLGGAIAGIRLLDFIDGINGGLLLTAGKYYKKNPHSVYEGFVFYIYVNF